MLGQNKSFLNTKNLSFLGLILLALGSYASKIYTITPDKQLLSDTTFTGKFSIDPLPQIKADINNNANVNIQDSVTGNTPLLNLLLTAPDGPVNFNMNYTTLVNDVNYLLSVPGVNPILTNNKSVTPFIAAKNLWVQVYKLFASYSSHPTDSQIINAPSMQNISIIIRKVANATLQYDMASSPLGLVLQDISNKAEVNAYGTTPGTATTPQNLNSNGQTSLSQAVLAANAGINPNIEPNTNQSSAFAIIFNLVTMTYNDGKTLRLNNKTLITPDNNGMTALMYAAQSTNATIDQNRGSTSGFPNGPNEKEAVNLEVVNALLNRYTQQLQTTDADIAISINQLNPNDGKTALDYANAAHNTAIAAAIKAAGGVSASASLATKSPAKPIAKRKKAKTNTPAAKVAAK